MSQTQFTTASRQMLLALLLFGADEASNAELYERFRVKIEKAPRELFLKSKWITVSKRGSAYLHTLTSEGRERARAEMAETAPASAGAGVKLLYAMANVLHRVMAEHDLKTVEVFTGSPTTDTSKGELSEQRVRPGQTVEQQILSAYSGLAKRRGDLVSLVKLRGHLPGIARETLDQTLKAMDRQRTILLEPDPNQKALPPQAHEAAIRIGGEDKHFITVGHR